MRNWSVVLPAAVLLGGAFLASAPAHAVNARRAWSDLWQRPDQQGQALLDAGEPAQAAERFHDPRRRAYADLEGGRYQDAAKLLAPYNDPESEYNRGNALARSGELQAALAAYDAALKQDPADKDIRHNRDLVERALRHARPSPQSSRSRGQPGSSSGRQQRSAPGRQNGSGSQRTGASPKPASGSSQGSGANPSGANSSGDNSAQSGAPGPQSKPAADSNREAQRDAAQAVALARLQRQRSKAGNASPTQRPGSSGASGSTPSAAQSPDSGSLLAGGTQTPKQKPETEKQLALDQWLRQIPDSPAGLLQRKFLIEHMVRQEESSSPEGSH